MHSLSSSPEGRIGQWDYIAYSNTLRPVLPMGQPQFLHSRPIKFSWYVATISRLTGLIATYVARLVSTLFHSPSCRPSSSPRCFAVPTPRYWPVSHQQRSMNYWKPRLDRCLCTVSTPGPSKAI